MWMGFETQIKRLTTIYGKYLRYLWVIIFDNFHQTMEDYESDSGTEDYEDVDSQDLEDEENEEEEDEYATDSEDDYF